MKAYELFQIDRGRGELRCAVAARHRDRRLDSDLDAIARVLDGQDLVVDPRDKSIAEHLLVCGFWEWWISQAVADCMRPGTICVDVGANAGYFAALFCSLGAAHTVAIEPHPELARRLRQSALRNGWRGMRGVLARNPDMHVFAEVTVNAEAAPWLREVAVDFPLRFVDYDGSLRSLDVDRLADRPLWMVYLHRD